MPRLSVDIDLTYTPIKDRETSLKEIDEALGRMSSSIEALVPGTKIQGQKGPHSRRLKSLLVLRAGASVKIEPNLVIRGAVYPWNERYLVKTAEKFFNFSVSARILSIADLYGGKICAALDRQHPRDLFDVKVLFESESLTKEIRKAFVVYLASHDRPMHELLSPTLKHIRAVFDTDFADMTREPVGYKDLLETRKKLIAMILRDLTQSERQFLLSVKRGEPDWTFLGLKGIDQFPAIQWKLRNIRKMEKNKHRQQLDALRSRLGL